MQVTGRGVVYPAQCDAMGHFNVQHYVGVFDQAMWHLVLHLGFQPSWNHDRREGWADVRYLINFKRELTAGQLFHAESEVRRIGNSSLDTYHRLLNSETNEIAADVEITSVYFDLAARRSKPLPVQIRDLAERSLKGTEADSA